MFKQQPYVFAISSASEHGRREEVRLQPAVANLRPLGPAPGVHARRCPPRRVAGDGQRPLVGQGRPRAQDARGEVPAAQRQHAAQPEGRVAVRGQQGAGGERVD